MVCLMWGASIYASEYWQAGCTCITHARSGLAVRVLAGQVRLKVVATCAWQHWH